MKTYISLFSSAGVGCFGFKQAGFECIATNEKIPRRLDIQKYNNKCKYESGYICGDITNNDIKELLLSEVEFWKKHEGMERVDVVIATPPCQGMSIANHKKTSNEIVRNSLVVESIKLIRDLRPKFFIIENVPSFMNTICTDIDGVDRVISDVILRNLGNLYCYDYKTINFKDYGACSSRQRVLVIGVAKDYAEDISPIELYPSPTKPTNLRNIIGHLPSLSILGEITPNDIYHAFRPYPANMRSWISDLKEGESAFDNIDNNKKPHKIVNNQIVINKRNNGDKYKRQYWNKVGPCIHTRNDQLASQNTIHPKDDRVFSIRELMLLMTIPDTFKWSPYTFESLNTFTISEKESYLKKNAMNIRQSIGEAVPTVIFREIANHINMALSTRFVNARYITKIIDEHNFSNVDELISFIDKNPLNLSSAALSRIAELSNAKRINNAAFYTSRPLITEIIRKLPDCQNDSVRILEPSVGVGNFIPLIIKKFENKKLDIDVIDIDADSIKVFKALIKHYNIPKNCNINFIVDDFLTRSFDTKYDYIIGNPPFDKLNSSNNMLKIYRQQSINQNTSNICSFFLDKALSIGNYIAFVFPKFLLNTPEFTHSRDYLSKKAVEHIIDFGENGFPGVLIETIAIFINNLNKPSKTHVVSIPKKIDIIQKQKYIFDPKYPYWLIYRNTDFDIVGDKMKFGVFDAFRDRQITNIALNSNKGIRVVKSRNITDEGNIIDINGYDSYINEKDAINMSVYSFLNRDDVYLTPNMTYKPRVIKKPVGILVNGSVAILIPHDGIKPTNEQLAFFSSDEYRAFYQIARNYQTRSLNVDNCSVYFYGLLDYKQEGIIDA